LLLVDRGLLFVDRLLLLRVARDQLSQLCVTLVECCRQWSSGVEHEIPSSTSNLFSTTMMEIVHILADRARALSGFFKVSFRTHQPAL
jgi:hypothetical protein